VTTRVVVWTVEPKKTRVADGQTTTVYLRAPCMGMVAITVTTGKRFATMRVNESDIAGQKQKNSVVLVHGLAPISHADEPAGA
jgi:hypothetical protein